VIDALVAALLECIVFLELGNDDQVNPDDAVKTMESVAYILGRMSPEDRASLASVVLAHAVLETNPERRSVFESMPEALGLVDAHD
jgi:hypothetical protein